MSATAAREIIFIDFCKVLEDIRTSPKHALKQQKLEEFFIIHRRKCEELKSTDFFPILRLLLPHLDRERPAYDLKRFALRRILAKLLSLPKDSDSYQKLGSEQYDFAETAYNLLRKQFIKSKRLNILDINQYLDSIAQRQTENHVAHQEKIFSKLFQETSPEEQKWIIRIVLKQMSLRLGDTKILSLYHPNAVALLNNTNNLLMVCNTCDTNPNISADNLDITLFIPIRPMLSKRCDVKELYKSVTDNKIFIVETKFDGERFQLHMENDRFKFFSRGGYDYTKKYGDSYTTGIYTPLLKGLFNKNVKSVLLDGEMMGWNRRTNEFGSKGMNFDVKNLTDTTLYQPCFCVFDILFYNGEVLINKCLQDRLIILKDVFQPKEGVILHSIRKEAFTKEDIIKFLNDSMDNKEEGIIYKDPNSLYVPNKRTNWWKVKLEYFSGVMSDLDVIIMGGFYNKAKKIDGFIVGIAVPSEIGSMPKKYLALAKITIGLKADEWDAIRKLLDPHWIQTAGDNYLTYGLDFGKMKPDVWIPAKKSRILVVRATELTKAERTNHDFKTPYSLRFPRIESINFDKPYYDCLTLTELDSLIDGSHPVQKLYNKHVKLEDLEYELKKIKKYKGKFADTNVDVEERVSDILKNHEFYVLSGSSEWKIDEIECTIKQNGGNVVKAEGVNTYCILAGEKHTRLDYYKGSIDVVKLSWLQKILDYRKLIPYSPQDVIYTSKGTMNRFLRDYDRYGDSFTGKATKYNLEYVFKNIHEKGDYINLLPAEIDAFHKEIKFKKNLRLFHDHIVYFDKYKSIGDPTSEIIYDSLLDELDLKFWGGLTSDDITNCNYIITLSQDPCRRDEILGHISNNSHITIVNKSYLQKKISEYDSHCSNF